MTRLAELNTGAVLDDILPSGTPLGEARGAMDAAHSAAWGSTDPALLELCRVRTAQLLGCAAEVAARTPAAVDAGLADDKASAVSSWPTSPLFNDCERAALAFTEEYLIDVSALTDETAGALRTHLGDAGLSDFVNALLVVEQRIRLRLAWSSLFDDPSAGSSTP